MGAVGRTCLVLDGVDIVLPTEMYNIDGDKK